MVRPDLVAVHAVYVDKKEIDLLAGCNVKISHNPTANMFLGDDVARISSMKKAGMCVGLGTNSGLDNNTLSVFHEMKMAGGAGAEVDCGRSSSHYGRRAYQDGHSGRSAGSSSCRSAFWPRANGRISRLSTFPILRSSRPLGLSRTWCTPCPIARSGMSTCMASPQLRKGSYVGSKRPHCVAVWKRRHAAFSRSPASFAEYFAAAPR